nr:MAG TPA: hypothetical protein [Caudoviricetes sp.]
MPTTIKDPRENLGSYFMVIHYPSSYNRHKYLHSIHHL